MSSPGGIRLNKYISESGLCSRREADKYIANGNVFINGRKAVIGDQVRVGDRVRVNGRELEPRAGEDIVFIALNKPPGITSTTEEGVHDNIVRFVNHSKRIFPIGRLDKDSQGLIFLTNQGDLVNKILRAGNQHEKEYLVKVNKPVSDDVLVAMSNGVPILGVVTKKCKIVRESSDSFRITLIQGLNRQIRRMCEHFGLDVLRLERVRIMNITLKGLAQGDWRDLTESEFSQLLSLVEKSSSEDHKKMKTPSAKPKGDKNTPPKNNSKSTSKRPSQKPFKHKSGHSEQFGKGRSGKKKPGPSRSGSKNNGRRGR